MICASNGRVRYTDTVVFSYFDLPMETNFRESGLPSYAILLGIYRESFFYPICYSTRTASRIVNRLSSNACSCEFVYCTLICETSVNCK